MLGQLLHGSWRYFIACIAASLLFTAFELVIPQIIRVSVDSLIGSGPVKVAAARSCRRWAGWTTSGRICGSRRP